MSSCTCPACFKYPPYRTENFGWGLTFKATQLKNNEQKEEQTQSEQRLSPSPYDFLYSFPTSRFSNARQFWGNDSLFTFNKNTANISTGISSKSRVSSDNDNSENANESIK